MLDGMSRLPGLGLHGGRQQQGGDDDNAFRDTLDKLSEIGQSRPGRCSRKAGLKIGKQAIKSPRDRSHSWKDLTCAIPNVAGNAWVRIHFLQLSLTAHESECKDRWFYFLRAKNAKMETFLLNFLLFPLIDD